MPLTEGRSHWPQSWQKAAYAAVLSHALRHASEVARTQPEHTTAWEFKAGLKSQCGHDTVEFDQGTERTTNTLTFNTDQ